MTYLQTVTVNSRTTTFYYDGDGQRVKKVDASGMTVCVGNHWVEIEVWGTRTTVYAGAHYEKDITSDIATSYYYAGSQRIAMREQTLSTNVVYYLHADHLGSASLTTDASGNKIADLRYAEHPGA